MAEKLEDFNRDFANNYNKVLQDIQNAFYKSAEAVFRLKNVTIGKQSKYANRLEGEVPRINSVLFESFRYAYLENENIATFGPRNISYALDVYYGKNMETGMPFKVGPNPYPEKIAQRAEKKLLKLLDKLINDNIKRLI